MAGMAATERPLRLNLSPRADDTSLIDQQSSGAKPSAERIDDSFQNRTDHSELCQNPLGLLASDAIEPRPDSHQLAIAKTAIQPESATLFEILAC